MKRQIVFDATKRLSTESLDKYTMSLDHQYKVTSVRLLSVIVPNIAATQALPYLSLTLETSVKGNDLMPIQFATSKDDATYMEDVSFILRFERMDTADQFVTCIPMTDDLIRMQRHLSMDRLTFKWKTPSNSPFTFNNAGTAQADTVVVTLELDCDE